jgi:hypothetical protein
MAWRGNPVQPSVNPAPNPINRGVEMAQAKVTENRAQNMRRDKDTKKDFSVTLIDVDTTILNYLDTNINPTVVDAGRLVKVPINYASPERWKAIRKDGYMRDKHGKVQCPALVFRRSTMQRNDNLLTLNRYLQYPAVKLFSEKNQYDKFSMMTGFKPTKEVYSVAMPDHVIINYDFVVWTDLVEQGNAIIERINFATEDYWGDKHRFKFRTSISDYNFQVEVSAEQDRIVKTTFSMMVYAYLLPDRYENYKSVVQKAFTTRKIVFNVEATGKTIQEAEYEVARLTELNGNKVPVIDEKVVETEPADVGSDYTNTKALDYQSFMATKTGSLWMLNNGSGSSVYTFASTSFNTETSVDGYQKFMLFIDDKVMPTNAVTYYQSGSSLNVEVVNELAGLVMPAEYNPFPSCPSASTASYVYTVSTSSVIVGYGNIV